MASGNLGQYNISVVLDTAGLTAGLSQATAAMQRANEQMAKSMQQTSNNIQQSMNSIGSSSRNVSSSASIGFASLAGKLTAVAAAAYVVKSAFESTLGAIIGLNASAEQAKIGFTTMLGSAEAAAVFMQKLNDFAAQTPFELPQLIDASKKMLAFGWAANDVIPSLTAVGDAVAAIGGGQEKIERVTMALGQMKAKGRVQGDELLQLAEAGIPAYEILAQKLNLTGNQVAKIGDQGISADKAIKALVEGMSEKFGGMMKKQSESFTGMVSTIKDDVRILATAMGEGMFESVKGAVAKIRDTLDGLIKSFRSGGFQQVFKDFVPKEFQSTIEQAFNFAIKMIDQLKASTGSMGDTWDKACAVMGQVLKALGPVVEVVIVQIVAQFKNIVATIQFVVEIVQWLVETVVEKFNSLSTITGEHCEFINSTLISAWKSIGNFIVSIIDWVVEKVANNFGKLGQIVQNFWNKIKNNAAENNQNIKDVMSGNNGSEFTNWLGSYKAPNIDLEKGNRDLANHKGSKSPTIGDDSGKKESNKVERAAKEQLEDFEQELQAKKDALDAFHEYDLATEKAFWQSKLPLITAGTDAEAKIKHNIAELDKKIAKKTFDDKVELLREEMEAVNVTNETKLAKAQQIAKEVAATYGIESKEYRKIQREIAGIQNDIVVKQREINTQIAQLEKDKNQNVLDIARDHNQVLLDMGAITDKEFLNRERQYIQDSYALEVDHLNKKLERYKGDAEAQQEIKKQLAQAELDYNKQIASMDDKAFLEKKKNWLTLAQDVSQSIGDITKDLLKGTKSWSDAFKAIGNTIKESLLNIVSGELTKKAMKVMTSLFGNDKKDGDKKDDKKQKAKELTELSAAETAKTGIVIAGEKARLAEKKIASAAASAMGAASATAMVAASTAAYTALLGMMSAMAASIAAIPPTGPAMAAAMTTAIGTSTAALTAASTAATAGINAAYALPSAAGGWDKVPNDTLANIHKDEMVLSAPYANGLRSLIENGSTGGQSSAGGHATFNVYAMDSQDVNKFFNKHGGSIADSLWNQKRKFKGFGK